MDDWNLGGWSVALGYGVAAQNEKVLPPYLLRYATGGPLTLPQDHIYRQWNV